MATPLNFVVFRGKVNSEQFKRRTTTAPSPKGPDDHLIPPPRKSSTSIEVKGTFQKWTIQFYSPSSLCSQETQQKCEYELLITIQCTARHSDPTLPNVPEELTPWHLGEPKEEFADNPLVLNCIRIISTHLGNGFFSYCGFSFVDWAPGKWAKPAIIVLLTGV